MILTALIISACVDKDKIFDENTKPTKQEAEYFIKETLKGISADPSSVNIDFIGTILWHEDFGWVIPCNFTMVNMIGRQERQLFYFAIKGPGKFGVNILTDAERNSLEALSKDLGNSRYAQRVIDENSTGIWRTGNYVDNFGDPTDKKFLTNNKPDVTGTYNDSGATNRPLNGRFIIDNSTKISLQLYENNRDTPARLRWSYDVSIENKDGIRNQFDARGATDRMTFDKSSQVLHDAFLKGGKIRFHIQNKDIPETQYNLEIPNADGYKNAYSLLVGE